MQLVNIEKFTNIQRAQAGLTRLFKKAGQEASFYRVMKNDEPLGVLVPNRIWESFVEDMEALSSPSYLGKISASRKDRTRISSLRVKKILDIK